MLKPQMRWHVQDTTTHDDFHEISQSLGIHPQIAKLLYLRGIKEKEEIKRFLYIDESSFHDPFLLDGMDKAVKRIQSAILKNEKILIYGDYDADGVTSTAIVYKTLKSLDANFAFYIPNRFSEGYGLNTEAIEKAAEKGFKVIVTVDTGISAIDEARVAKELGVCLIITDHHEPHDELPDAFSVINPKKTGDNYPFKYLAGVGVAFKLAHALLGRIPYEFLDIAAVGTISDLVPLVDENRLIVSLGLKSMTTTKHVGLRVLLEQTGLLDKEINSGHIGFIIGPRINASGRLDSANHAVKLFITDQEEEAEELAQLLENINKERQTIVEKIAKEANELIFSQQLENDKVIILAKEEWNEGVIGIVASRILEKYYRPTIVLSVDKETGMAKGSARSIEGYDIYQALTTAKDLLPNYGGHPAAAGLSIKEEDIPKLRTKLNQLAEEWLTEEDFIPLEKADVICSIDEIDIDLVKQMEALAPFGIGNATPKILIDDIEINQVIALGKEQQHLKLTVGKKSKAIDALFFRKGELRKDIALHSKVKLLGELSLNTWNGQTKPQMLVKDLDIPFIQVFDWRKIEPIKSIKDLELEDTLIAYDERVGLLNGLGEDWLQLSYKELTQNRVDDKRNLILLHLPRNLETIKQILLNFSSLERIYCICSTDRLKSKSAFLKREHFKQVYLLLKQNNVQSMVQAEKLIENINITKEILQYILDVFEELDFLKKAGDNIILHSNPEKRDLSQSSKYKIFLEQEKIKDLFLYSNHQMLRNWFVKQTLGE